MFLKNNWMYNLTTFQEALTWFIIITQWWSIMLFLLKVQNQELKSILGSSMMVPLPSQELEDLTLCKNTWTSFNTLRTIWMKTLQMAKMLQTSLLLLKQHKQIWIQNTMMVSFKTQLHLTQRQIIQSHGLMQCCEYENQTYF